MTTSATSRTLPPVPPGAARFEVRFMSAGAAGGQWSGSAAQRFQHEAAKQMSVAEQSISMIERFGDGVYAVFDLQPLELTLPHMLDRLLSGLVAQQQAGTYAITELRRLVPPGGAELVYTSVGGVTAKYAAHRHRSSPPSVSSLPLALSASVLMCLCLAYAWHRHQQRHMLAGGKPQRLRQVPDDDFEGEEDSESNATDEDGEEEDAEEEEEEEGEEEEGEEEGVESERQDTDGDEDIAERGGAGSNMAVRQQAGRSPANGLLSLTSIDMNCSQGGRIDTQETSSRRPSEDGSEEDSEANDDLVAQQHLMSQCGKMAATNQNDPESSVASPPPSTVRIEWDEPSPKRAIIPTPHETPERGQSTQPLWEEESDSPEHMPTRIPSAASRPDQPASGPSTIPPAFRHSAREERLLSEDNDEFVRPPRSNARPVPRVNGLSMD